MNVEGITIRVFSREVVGIAEGVLRKTLTGPLPWHRCTPGQKEQFRRMHAWLQTKKNIQRLRALSSKSFTRGFRVINCSKSQSVGRLALKNEWLNTKRIAERVNTLLKRHGINSASLARRLGINSVDVLLGRPNSWCMCDEQNKHAYRNLRDWVYSFKSLN
jgi:hypothetical protein